MDQNQINLPNTRSRVRKQQASKKMVEQHDQVMQRQEEDERDNDTAEISQFAADDSDTSPLRRVHPSEENYKEEIEFVNVSSEEDEPNLDESLPYVRDETEYIQEFSGTLIFEDRSTPSRKRTRSYSLSDSENEVIGHVLKLESRGSPPPSTSAASLPHTIEDSNNQDDDAIPAVIDQSQYASLNGEMYITHDQLSKYLFSVETLYKAELSSVKTRLSSVETELSSVKRELSSIKRKLSSTKSDRKNGPDIEYRGTATDTWIETFGVEFPLRDLDSLHLVETQLQEFPELKNTLCSAMTHMLDADDTFQKNVTFVIRKLFTRDLAIKLTATRKMGDKIVFALRLPKTYRCILEFLSSSLKKSETKVAAAIGTAFTHSLYWDGHRGKLSKVQKTHEEQ